MSKPQQTSKNDDVLISKSSSTSERGRKLIERRSSEIIEINPKSFNHHELSASPGSGGNYKTTDDVFFKS